MRGFVWSTTRVLAMTLAVGSRPVDAATTKEALKCDLAIRKLQAKQLSLLGKAIVTLCKSRRIFRRPSTR